MHREDIPAVYLLQKIVHSPAAGFFLSRIKHNKGTVYLLILQKCNLFFIIVTPDLIKVFRVSRPVPPVQISCAAVGAGFAAFESAQYAYDAYLNAILQMNISYDELLLHGVSMVFVIETLLPVLISIVLRGVCAVCCHVLYCAPYSCVAALYTRDGNPFAALRHMDFWVVFLLSAVAHALWNAPWGSLLLKLPAATALLWLSCRYGVRKSFGQLSACVATAGQGAASALRVQCVAGVHAGVAFALTKPEILIGSDADCLLSYPVSTPGISGRHCKLLVRQGQLYLADMGSHAGTYLNGARLHPGTGYPLKAGDSFTLGSDEQAFTVV